MASSMLRRKLLRDIWTHKVQFTALCVVVILGVSIYSSLIMAMENLNRSYKYAYEELQFADFTILLNPTHQKSFPSLKR